MSETIWINNEIGTISSIEQLLPANTSLNLYNITLKDTLKLTKKGPDGNFYPHNVDGKNILSFSNSSILLLTGGIYKITGTTYQNIYVTYDQNLGYTSTEELTFQDGSICIFQDESTHSIN